MPFTYYTESRLVPIYRDNPKVTPTAESVMMTPQCQVETTTDQDSYNLGLAPYVEVQVTVGQANGAAPVWWPNGWVLRKFLRKCLKASAPSSVTGESFTGVSYGDYKFKSDAASKDASARFVKNKEEILPKPDRSPRVYKPGYFCAVCGRLSADHRLYETVRLRALAKSLVAAHGTQTAPPMFGILDVRESDGSNHQLVLAESGFNYYFATTVAAQIALFHGVAHHYVTDTDITAMNAQYKDCSGNDIETPSGRFSCAAPKLVQYYAHNLRTQYRAPVLYMSEVAATTSGIYVQGHTAESCDTCRNTMPKMLCTLTNLERQVDDGTGRYPRRQRT